MQKKRILYVITKSSYGGAQRYVFELACAAKEAGHTVAVACAPSGLLVDKLQSADIEHIAVPQFQRDISIRKELSVLRTLWHIYKTFSPDTVHLNSSKAGVLGSLIAIVCRVPNRIFTAHGWPFREHRSQLWKTMAWLGSYLTALCVHTVIVVTQKDLQTGPMIGTKRKLVCIHTAVASFYKKTRIDARAVLFSPEIQKQFIDAVWMVSIAELTKNKNIRAAITAVAQHNKTHEQKVFYTIIGDGELSENLRELAESLAAEPYIHFAGYIDNAREHLAAFDVMILPSLKEGLPYALLEAGAANLAVIASDVGGVSEVVTHNVTGLLYQPTDADALQQHLATITNPQKRKDYSDALHTHVAENFSLHEMCEKTLQLY